MKFKFIYSSIVFIIVLIVNFSCEKLVPASPSDEDLLEGPINGLSTQEINHFIRGDEAFNEVFTTHTGLGPLFVATSCAACHSGDGKGHLLTTLTRFGQIDSTGNHFLGFGGPQLQNRALPGYIPEKIPPGAKFSKFTPPAVTGLGYLSAVSDADILSHSDPNDLDGDGISGVPNWIEIPSYVIPTSNAITKGDKYIGRFGKKAAAHNLLHQTVNAYNQDMGITSLFHPFDVYSGLEIDPEVTTQTIHDVVFYMQTLKAPIPRHQNDHEQIRGKEIFNQIKCGSCHLPTLKTGNSSIQGLAFKEFYPYTDLLLHDMGPDLDDGYTEGKAKTAEWRTPALWGLGLSPNSQGGQYFLMHDGRARSIEDAILWHGGEASSNKNLYQNLPQQDKDDLIKFLKSL